MAGKHVIKPLSFFHLNIQSLVASSDDGFLRFDHLFNYCCRENSFDVILLSETHLDCTIESAEINIDGYQLFRKDRNRFGGGCAIYARNELSPSEIISMNEPHVESIYIKILSCNVSTVFGVCYRPPNQPANQRDLFLDGFGNQLTALSTNSKTSFHIMGDFNDRCDQWTSDHSESELGLLLVNLLYEFNLNQLVIEPTRGRHILDLLITSSHPNDCIVNVIESFDNLDHDIVTCTLNLCYKKQLSYTRVMRNFSNERLNVLNSNLLIVPWHTFLNDNVNDSVYNVTKVIIDELNSVIPPLSVTIRPRDKPGWNSTIRKLFNNTHRLLRRARLTKSPIDIENHRESRRIAKRAWYKSQKDFHQKLYAKTFNSEGRAKTYWKILKLNFGGNRAPNISTIIDGDGKYHTCDASKSEVLNKAFVSQSTLNLSEEPGLPHEVTMLTDAHLDHIEVSSSSVLLILKSLDVSKATGPDGIGNNILKMCASALCEPIKLIAQLSLNSGFFPSAWKMANITPVFKKGDKQNPCNYRPISLLTNMSKVLEKVVYNHLYEYCTVNSLLSSKNSGFKKGDGAVNQLPSISNNIYQSFELGCDVAMVFLDISRAFDKVWHKGLIYKLKCIGVGGTLLSWFTDYLSFRQQKVVIGGQESSFLKTNAGVPQGSILGPLLFLIFINDIENNIKSDMFIFADDTTLLKSYCDVYEAESCLCEDLNSISIWAKKWMVDFNIKKTIFVNFTLKREKKNLQLYFNGVQVTQQSEHKHLGVVLSDDLKWTKHINYIVGKALQKIGALYRQSSKLSRSQIESIYLSMIRPVLEYGSILFDNCSLSDEKCIENVQRRAAILCTGAMRRSNSALLMEEVGWDSLKNRRTISKLIFFFKLCNGQGPPHLQGTLQFAPVSQRGCRSNTKHNRIVLEPFCRLTCNKKSFFPDCIHLWNSLNTEIVNSPTLFMFKNHLKKWMKPIESKHYVYPHLKECCGYMPKLLTQFRLGLTPLRNDLFTHNIIDNPFCPSCGDCIETSLHFFFFCRCYKECRAILLREIESIFCVNAPLLSEVLQDYKILLNYLIGRAVITSDIINTSFCGDIFRSVSRYVFSTGRFAN